jgi:hypothetical protein
MSFEKKIVPEKKRASKRRVLCESARLPMYPETNHLYEKDILFVRPQRRRFFPSHVLRRD